MVFHQNIVKYCDQNFENKNALIQFLGDMLFEEKKITNKEEYIEAVKKREKEVSTEVGYSIAIPHGESKSVIEPFVACLKLNKPMKWDSQEVQYIFNIGIPAENRNTDQIRILAMLSSNLMIEDFRNKLYNTTNEMELYNVLKQIERGDA